MDFPKKEELTTAMHSEFSVDKETETKHRVFSLLTLCGTDNPEKWDKWMPGYNITKTDVESYIDEFINLQNGTEE